MPISSGSSAGAATGDDNRSPRFDTSVAHPARTWDYWLGGKDNFYCTLLCPTCDDQLKR